jgi:nucleotide-binding universal stress UspA family protein
MATFNSILVPTDFSSHAEHALQVALQLVKDFGASITLLHAYEIATFGYPGFGLAPADLLKPVENAAGSALAQALADLQKDVPGAKAVLRQGYPPDEIVNAVEELNIDLVVMGTHGRRGLSHALLGSVAERVVRACPVPVLTIRASTKGPR